MLKRKIYLICNNNALYCNKRFTAESQRHSYDLTTISPYTQNIDQSLFSQTINRVLFRSAGTNYDDFDLLLAQRLTLKPEHIYNPVLAFENFRDKNLQVEILSSLSIPIIQTYSFRGQNTYNELTDQQFVVKTQRGFGGKGVYLMKNKKDVISFLEFKKKIGDERYIVQPFISKKTELRAFIIKDECRYLIEKKPLTNSFKGNKDFSEQKKFIANKDIKTQIWDIQEKLKKFNLAYYALDLFLVNEKVITLEINLTPGFEALEELTNDNIAFDILNLTLAN